MPRHQLPLISPEGDSSFHQRCRRSATVPSGATTLRSIPLASSRAASPRPMPPRGCPLLRRPARPCWYVRADRPAENSASRRCSTGESVAAFERCRSPVARCSLGLLFPLRFTRGPFVLRGASAHAVCSEELPACAANGAALTRPPKRAACGAGSVAPKSPVLVHRSEEWCAPRDTADFARAPKSSGSSGRGAEPSELFDLHLGT